MQGKSTILQKAYSFGVQLFPSKIKPQIETMIENYSHVEGNLQAVKCSDSLGGRNMWNLYVKNTEGWWEQVQWMDVRNIQKFFNHKLPIYKEE